MSRQYGLRPFELGLATVAIRIFLGVLLGGISGYYGRVFRLLHAVGVHLISVRNTRYPISTDST